MASISAGKGTCPDTLVVSDNASKTLFDESGDRSDSSPSRHLERSFHFLNRRAGAFWDRVRGHLESSYAAFPDEHKHGLVTRLRDDDERQHLPAWWELYTFTLFDSLGYAIELHPDLTGSTRKEDRPDFLVTKGTVTMYVEAAVVFNGYRDSDAWNWVCDCVNDAKNPDFLVDLEIPVERKRRPTARKIIAPLEQWLATLDADRVLGDQDAGRPYPHIQLLADDWILEYTAVPVRPDRRGISGRLIGSYPTRPVDFSTDVKQLRKTLKDKGSKYGKLDNPLDKPLIMAIATWNAIDEPELTDALLGADVLEIPRNRQGVLRRYRKRDGYWRPGAERRGARISAVLFGDTMRAWRVASKLPELWINPWPLNPVPPLSPFATVAVDDEGRLTRTHASTTAAEVFGLSPQWPNSD
jgi:hypothetical protein